MIKFSTTIATIVVAFAVTEGVFADMTPAADVRAPFRPAMVVCGRMAPKAVNSPVLPSAFASANLGGAPAYPSVHKRLDPTGTDAPTKPASVLASDEGSLGLCVYTLLGLGLCRSGHWVKRSGLGLGQVPDWYHSGGPYRIGDSEVAGPDLQHLSPSLCLIQPDNTFGTMPSLRGSAETALLCRKSQRTPAVLTSRGPPRATTQTSAV